MTENPHQDLIAGKLAWLPRSLAQLAGSFQDAVKHVGTVQKVIRAVDFSASIGVEEPAQRKC